MAFSTRSHAPIPPPAIRIAATLPFEKFLPPDPLRTRHVSQFLSESARDSLNRPHMQRIVPQSELAGR
jgi:hypothetical protein